jgi:hypothetical protein
MVKCLITGGCSFTAWKDRLSWVDLLEEYLKFKNNNLKSIHTAHHGQGQGQIQKKVMLAVSEAFDNGLSPEEILVVVMWSGTCRKSWYIDNRDILKKLSTTDAKIKDLKNNKAKVGGWFDTHNSSAFINELRFTHSYYLIDEQLGGVGKVHDSLENIVMLQNFCKLHGVKLIHQFFMDNVFEDIEKHKEHQIINYLYKQLDLDNLIKQGMLEYLESFLNIPKETPRPLHYTDRIKGSMGVTLFDTDGYHPGPEGVNRWFENIVSPFLKNKNI